MTCGYDVPETAVLFDLGGVLIDWNPRYFFRSKFKNEADMEYFLTSVCTSEWNRSIDAGKPFAVAVRERQAELPEYAELIGYWHTGWAEMLGEALSGTVEILRELKGQGRQLCALSNWSAETFPLAQERFDFLAWFSRIIVSGQVGLAKPDPAIFRLALEQCGLVAERTLFIDDVLENVEVARSLGLQAIQFRSPEQLRAELVARGVLPQARA